MKVSEQMELPLIVSDKCTLCGACANACPTAALGSRVLDGRVQLIFGVSLCKPSLCEALCVSVCPEKAISLHFPPPHRDTETAILAEDALVRCKACGLPYASERLKNRTRELLASKKANKAAIDATDYCPACRRLERSTLPKGMMNAPR